MCWFSVERKGGPIFLPISRRGRHWHMAHRRSLGVGFSTQPVCRWRFFCGAIVGCVEEAGRGCWVSWTGVRRPPGVLRWLAPARLGAWPA